MRRFLSLFALAATALLPSAASALTVPPSALHATDPDIRSLARTGALIEAPGEPPLRREVDVRYGAAPRRLFSAWNAFVADTAGAPWTVLWDTATHRPLRVFGGSIPAPGASHDAAAAEKHARDLLARHAGLLLAGRSLADFDLTVNDDDHGLRTVSWQQMVRAGAQRIPVIGGRVNVRFKNDRLFVLGSEALPIADFPAPQTTAAQAESAALAHLAPWQPGAVASATALVALPLVRARRFDVVLAWRVATESAHPASQTAVFVDARSGAVIATREGLRMLTGSLQYSAPLRGPQEHGPFPAERAHLLIDDAPAEADSAGQFSCADGAAAGSSFARSDVINVYNDAGTAAEFDFVPADGASYLWSLEDDEEGDAQVSAFVHASIAKAAARKIDPDMPFLNNTLQVKVNQDDPDFVCNAYWNGLNLNFFLEWQFCNNTARLADVVYHEFGHAFHTHTVLPSVGDYDPALAEGQADYFASIITGDPVLSPGFYVNGDYLREFDSDRHWPEDISWDPHETGLIFAGAMWDLRTILAEEIGPDEGPALAHQLYRGAIRRAPNIPATFAEVLATDDDDGDLSNGTPHVCQILRAFVPHGLTPYLSSSGLGMLHEAARSLPAQADPYELRAKLTETFPQCSTGQETADITIAWHTPGTSGKAPMAKEGEDYIGFIPGQVTGTQIKYHLVAEVDNTQTRLPQNLADQEYRAFVGETRQVYCTDFEQGAADWQFGETQGKTTDFLWGKPQGGGGDPAAAFSGESLIGTSLTSAGLYRRLRESFALGPVVELGEETHIRLQFMRWLSVEDGVFDHAQVVVNNQIVWKNQGTDEDDGTLTHQDLEWRFEDIDLSAFTAGGNHTVQVRFDLISDDAIEYGGWNIDDVCIVAWTPPPPDTGTGGSGGGGGDGGAGGDDDTDGSCACRTGAPAGDSPWALFGAAAAMALLRRRRR